MKNQWKKFNFQFKLAFLENFLILLKVHSDYSQACHEESMKKSRIFRSNFLAIPTGVRNDIKLEIRLFVMNLNSGGNTSR